MQFQRDSLQREITRLRKLSILSVPEVRPFPEGSFLEESANIEQLKHKAEEALQRKEQQQRKIDVLQNMGSSELLEEIIPHEQILREQRDRGIVPRSVVYRMGV